MRINRTVFTMRVKRTIRKACAGYRNFCHIRKNGCSIIQKLDGHHFLCEVISEKRRKVVSWCERLQTTHVPLRWWISGNLTTLSSPILTYEDGRIMFDPCLRRVVLFGGDKKCALAFLILKDLRWRVLIFFAQEHGTLAIEINWNVFSDG